MAKSKDLEKTSESATSFPADVEQSSSSIMGNSNDSRQSSSKLNTLTNAGKVSKRRKQKPISRQQRLRKEKGIARANTVLDQLDAKVKESREKYRTIKNRRVDWEELNTALGSKKSTIKRNNTHRATTGKVEYVEGMAVNGTNNSGEMMAAHSTHDAEQSAVGNVDELDNIT